MGLPFSTSKGFPGSLEEAYLAGITAIIFIYPNPPY